MFRRFEAQVACFDESITFLAPITANVARVAMMEITTSNSTRVNPCLGLTATLEEMMDRVVFKRL